MKVIKAKDKHPHSRSSEEFLPEKIVVAVVKSGASPAVAREIASEVEQKFKGRESVASSEINKEVRDALLIKDPNAYDSWRMFETMYAVWRALTTTRKEDNKSKKRDKVI